MKIPRAILAAAALLCSVRVSESGAQAPIDLPEYWAQTNAVWSGDALLDNPPHTIGGYGCTLTTAAMLLRYYGATTMPGGQPLNPRWLNQWLLGTGYFTSPANLSWPLLATFSNVYLGVSLQYRPPIVSPNLCCDPVSDPRCEEARASFYTSRGYPLPIRRTTSTCTHPLPPPATACCNKHSVLLLGEDEFFGQWYIANPANLLELPEVMTPNYWDKLTVLVPPSAPSFLAEEARIGPGLGKAAAAQTLSAPTLLKVNVSSAANVLIIDALGRKLGRDSSGANFAQIPAASAEVAEENASDQGAPGDLAGAAGWIVTGPAVGAWLVQVSGAGVGAGQLTWTLLGSDGTLLTQHRSDPGTGLTRVYNFTVPSSVHTASGAAGDTETLPGRIVCRVSLGPETLVVADPDLSNILYLRRAAPAGFDTYSPVSGARAQVSGNLSGSGALRVLETRSLLSLPPAGGNSAPRAARDSFATSDAELRIAKSQLLANDSDPNGQALSVAAVGLAPESAGVLSTSADSIRFTRPLNYAGTTEFLYTVSDPLGALGAASVRVRFSPTVGVVATDAGSALTILRVTEQRASGQISIAFSLPRPTVSHLTLLDVAGRVVARRDLSMLEAGQHDTTVEIGSPRAGVYFLQLRAGSDRATQKIVLMP